MSRNYTVSVTGNTSSSVEIGDVYSGVVVRKIAWDGARPTSGQVLIEYLDADNDWHPLNGGIISLSGDYSVMASVTGVIVNAVRVTLSGVAAGDTARVNIVVGNIVSDVTKFATDQRRQVMRLSVDSQQTSFEANAQFRFFDDLSALASGDGLASTDQLVYKFSSINAVNIFLRQINLWEGGRKYLVYPVDGDSTFTGTFEDVSDQLFPVNGHLYDGLEQHPTTGVTVQRAIGSNIFTTTALPRNGTAALCDGNANRAASAFTANGDRAGVDAGQEFYLVFYHIGQATSPTKGLFLIQYEERFPQP